MKNYANVVVMALFAAVFATAAIAGTASMASTPRTAVGQTRPAAETPAPIAIELDEVVVVASETIELDDVVIVADRPARRVTATAVAWKCGDWRESLVGGQYRECGWQ
jgi:hypothetical protein